VARGTSANYQQFPRQDISWNFPFVISFRHPTAPFAQPSWHDPPVIKKRTPHGASLGLAGTGTNRNSSGNPSFAAVVCRAPHVEDLYLSIVGVFPPFSARSNDQGTRDFQSAPLRETRYHATSSIDFSMIISAKPVGL